MKHTKKESHEELMKRAFGDDFWDRPVEERFDMAVTKMLQTRPEQTESRLNAKRKDRDDT
jgi:hypothetical protein